MTSLLVWQQPSISHWLASPQHSFGVEQQEDLSSELSQQLASPVSAQVTSTKNEDIF
jgi:hypothetical protein